MIKIFVFVFTLLTACRHKKYQCFASNLWEIKSSTGKEYRSMRNIKVDSDLISEYQTKSRIFCVAKCFSVQCCTSVAFNSKTSYCRLYDSNGKTYSGNVDSGWKYYLVDSCPQYDGSRFNRSLGLCYKEVLGGRNYQDSVDLCNTYNAELPKIQNEEELTFYKELMGLYIRSTAKVIYGREKLRKEKRGLHVRSTAKVIYGREKLGKKEKPEKSGITSIFLRAYTTDGIHWYWNSWDPLVYANWDIGQPQQNDENVAMMRKSENYRWHDYSIGAVSEGTICEYRKSSASCN